MNQLRGGRYQFIKTLKSDTTGQTYLVEDTQDETRPLCVVKRLQLIGKNPRTLNFVVILLRKKAEALQKLSNHDQIPRIIDFFDENQSFYIVEEFISGTLLSQEIESRSPLSEEQVFLLLQEISEILRVVHSWGVIHRCIVPSKFIRREMDGRLVLTGFGIFREISNQVMRSQDSSEPTSSDGTLTVHAPPEQLKGQVQFSSDIYAVGMIGIRALTGLSVKEIARLRPAALNGSHPNQFNWRDHTSVSDDLGNIIDRMVQPTVDRRYQLITEVLADLKLLHPPEPEAETPEPEEQKPREVTTLTAKPNRDLKSLKWLLAAGGIALLAGLGLGWLVHQRSPQNGQVTQRLNEAQQLQEEGSTTEAIAIYTQLLESNPTYEAHYGRGILHSQEGNHEQALEDFTQAITLDPTADAYYQRANVRFRLGDRQKASEDYTRALEFDSTMVKAFVNRGTVRAELGDEQGAVDDYTEAIRIDPTMTDAYLNRCLSRSNVGDHQGAIADCSQAIELQPNSVLAYQNRGLVRRRLGDLAGALDDLNIAIRLAPDDPDPYYNRGLTRSELGDELGAIEDFTSAIALNPDHSFAYYDRGLAYAKSGETEAAIEDFEQSAKLCLDLGRMQCYEDAQFQMTQLQNTLESPTE